jgi:hypothetical protein
MAQDYDSRLEYVDEPDCVAAGKLDAYNGLTADEHSAIDHGNVRILFPRLAPKDDLSTRPCRAADV